MARWIQLQVRLKEYPKLFGFILTTIMMVQLSYQEQHDGFVSIDCGSLDQLYIDSVTGLTWENDQKYIQQGVNGEVSIPINTSLDNSKALNSFRYFPWPSETGPDISKPTSYCYDLPLTKSNISFFIRAMFYRGQATVLDLKTEISVLVDSSVVSHVVILDTPQQVSPPIVWEGTFHSVESVTRFCLVSYYGDGTPFISSLELRELGPSSIMDSFKEKTQLFLSSIVRWNIGAPANSSTIRYPSDDFDRMWENPPNDIWSSTIGEKACDTEPVHMNASPLLNFSSSVPSKVLSSSCKWEGSMKISRYEVSRSGASAPPYFLEDFATPSFIYALVYLDYMSGEDEFGFNNHVTLNGKEGESFSPQYGVIRTIFQVHKSWAYNDITLNMIQNGSISNVYAVELFAIYIFDTSPISPTEKTLLQTLIANLNIKIPYQPLCRHVRDEGLVNAWYTCTSVREDSTPCILVYNDLRACEFKGVYPVHTLSVVKRISLPAARPNLHLTDSLIQAVVPIFNQFDYLSALDISSSGINQSGFEYFWQNIESEYYILEALDLSHNFIKSLVPIYSEGKSNTSALGALITLDISYNNLTTSVSSLADYVQSNLWSLDTLNASYNNIAGEVDETTDWYTLFNLQQLVLDGNRILGTLNLNSYYDLLVEERFAQYYNDHGKVAPKISFLYNNITNIKPGLNVFHDLFQSLEDYWFWMEIRNSSGVLLGGNPFCDDMSGPFAVTKSYFCRFHFHNDNVPFYNTPKPRTVTLRPKTFYIIMSVLAFFSIIGVLLMAICGGMVIRRSLKNVQALQQIQREIQRALEERQVQPPFYSYNDLKMATNDFHISNELGSGGFGAVHKGVLLDGTTIAVKRLFNTQQHIQVLNDFLNEVVLINGIKHKNLIQLKGCCIQERERILVYEYAEMGNLAQALQLQDQNTSTALNWDQRFNICVGIARGLCYLHEELQPRIIHRDIKLPNILLDRHLNAKIADFGLAKSFSEEQTHAEFTRVAGTRGYMAPEYASHGQLTEKADVFSFGILLLEIVSGRKCIDASLPRQQQFLKDWAESLQRDEKLLELLQPEFRETFPHDEVMKVIRIALICIQTDPDQRATMSQVVTMLLGSSTTLPELLYSPASPALLLESVLGNTAGSSGFRRSTNTIHHERIEEIDERPLLGQESGSLRSNSSLAELELTELSGR